MKKYLTAACLFLSTISIQAQNISSEALVWHVDACLDESTGISTSMYDKFVSYGHERIEWYDGAGTVKATFEIIEANGQWTNVMNNGAILYEVRSDGRQGTVQFSGVNGIPSIQIVLLKPDENPDKYRLSILSVTTL